ncbi:MAG TPA: hypothetical protein VK206_17055 [Anaerolineales bacterium]|nr:hypothetical protein [Anaerolineales bacterium]
MKHTILFVALTIIFILLIGFSCSPREAGTPVLSLTPISALTSPQDWIPPVFPGAVLDEEIRADMTSVAATPGAIDATACDCFGFSVHNAVFHAYRSNADPQDVMDFYAKQMKAEGWKKIRTQLEDPSLPRQVWQWGAKGPLVAYVMIMTMEDGRIVIYLSVAESDSPQAIIEE